MRKKRKLEESISSEYQDVHCAMETCDAISRKKKKKKIEDINTELESSREEITESSALKKLKKKKKKFKISEK